MILDVEILVIFHFVYGNVFIDNLLVLAVGGDKHISMGEDVL